MTPTLSFMMGEFQAEFPTDRLYAKNHMWAISIADQTYRFGFSAYAVRLLQDVYFLDIDLEPGSPITHQQEFGNIESKKAESGLYAPITGTLLAINPIVIQDPSAINVDKYGDGWLLDIRGPGTDLLSPENYLIHLEAAWEIAQRTIKGQANVDSE